MPETRLAIKVDVDTDRGTRLGDLTNLLWRKDGPHARQHFRHTGTHTAKGLDGSRRPQR